jgi:hypothetical protein
LVSYAIFAEIEAIIVILIKEMVANYLVTFNNIPYLVRLGQVKNNINLVF